MLLLCGSSAPPASTTTRPVASTRPFSGLQLTIEWGRQRAQAGTPIDLIIRLSNQSDREQVYLQYNPDCAFSFVVTDDHGQPVARTAIGNLVDQRRVRVVSAERRRLLPGQSNTYRIRLNRQFDMSEKGLYRVQADYVSARPVGEDPPISRSNELVIEIVDDN